VPEGPLAEEQVALVTLLQTTRQQAQSRAQEEAMRTVLSKKQLKVTPVHDKTHMYEVIK